MHALQSNGICVIPWDIRLASSRRKQTATGSFLSEQGSELRSWVDLDGLGYFRKALHGLLVTFVSQRWFLARGDRCCCISGQSGRVQMVLRLAAPPSTLKTSHHPALFCCSSLTVFVSTGTDVSYNFWAHWFYFSEMVFSKMPSAFQCGCFLRILRKVPNPRHPLVYAEWTLLVPKCHLFTSPAWPFFSFIHGLMTLSPLLWEKDC